MLVGPTGGGKTTVRRILEKALTLLPIEELILRTELTRSISQVNSLQNKTFLGWLRAYFMLQLQLHVLSTEVVLYLLTLLIGILYLGNHL